LPETLLARHPDTAAAVVQLRQLAESAGRFEAERRDAPDNIVSELVAWRRIALQDLWFRHSSDFERTCDTLLELCSESRDARELCVSAAVICLDPRQEPGRVRAALDLVQRGLARGANDFVIGDFLTHWGQVLYSNRRYEEALSALRQAESEPRVRSRQEFDGSRLRIRILQALCLRSLGKTAEADAVIQRVADQILPPPTPPDSPSQGDIGDGTLLFWLTVREAEEVFGRPLMPRAQP